MDSNSNLENNTAIIHQLLEELQTQIAVLEEQIETSLFLVQSEIDSVGGATSEEISPAPEDGSFLTGWH